MIRSSQPFVQRNLRRVSSSGSNSVVFLRIFQTRSPILRESGLLGRQHFEFQAPLLVARSLSSNHRNTSDAKEKNDRSAGEDSDPNNNENSKEIVLTPGEQVVAAGRLTMWAGIGVFALCCAYYIGVELFPT